MWTLIKTWLSPVLSPMYALVAGVFGVFLIVVRNLERKKAQNKVLTEEVKRAKRILDVKVNTDRDAATERLRRDGKVRDD